MELTVNGESHQHEGDGTIQALLEEMGSRPDRTAVMVNGDVVPRERWDGTRLEEGDTVELLVFAGGG
jgi:thiamine biosynthesis protein ThiS